MTSAERAAVRLSTLACLAGGRSRGSRRGSDPRARFGRATGGGRGT